MKNSSKKLAALRDKLAEKELDGYLVPRADEWQGEYVPARAARLAWLTGFTGSAGMAVIGQDKALVTSDGRYDIQLAKQVDPALFGTKIFRPTAKSIAAAINDAVPQGGSVGYDPHLHTVRNISALQSELDKRNIKLVPIEGNLIDAIWDDQPEHPAAKAVIDPEEYAGESSADKRAAVVQKVREADAAAILLTAPDSIAWLLNIRGGDVPYTPFALSYAVVHDDGHVDWFIPSDKITDEVREHIGPDVTIYEFEEIPAELTALAAKGKILIDESSAPQWFESFLKDAGAALEHMDDPVAAAKIIKNETELKHMKDVHIKDGVALTKFWKWVDENAPKGGMTELDVVEKLHAFRKEQPGFLEESFETIAGWGPNGAITHYAVDEQSNATITSDNLLLVDSGAQYENGTTDNTRVWAVGTPTDHMVKMSTRVLKGHIAVASAVFKEGKTGKEIDMLARQFLLKEGYDYNHGTGHDIDRRLSVHGSCSMISSGIDRVLKPGMVMSNEPGYYETDENNEENGFGIRWENVVVVEKCTDKKGEVKLCFNTISLTPIDLRLVDVDLLDADEIKWLNDYHERVYNELSPYLDADEQAWLREKTAPVSRPLTPPAAAPALA